jgi:hypothetical protein
MAVAPGSFFANVYPTVGTPQPLTVSQFIAAPKPGNAAVCLSGGGSRALSAGMGQLNALQTLQLTPNATLLSQVKALSTVSGGSWVGLPFVYLPASTTDEHYLGGPYIPPNQLTLQGLGTFPAGCIGAQITTDFTIEDMFVQALLLCLEGVPTDMLWQTIIALQLLSPYGLFRVENSTDTPNSFFTYNQNTLSAILSENPALRQEMASLVSRQPRPYLVCNTGLFVDSAGQSLLAPVQATSFMTGVVSEPPNAIDANGFKVGGGGVSSFAFSSAPTAFERPIVTVQQERQWALADSVGSSSAAFAASLRQLASAFAIAPERIASLLRDREPAAHNFLARRGLRLNLSPGRIALALAAHVAGDSSDLRKLAGDLQNLIPAYQYWPALNPPVNQPINTTQFADGGSLDNSGIAAMLAYSDIQTIIAFTNTSTPLSMDQMSNIVVDDSLPPLFGYQPYVEGVGYAPYQGASNPSNPLFQKNQVFPSSIFQDLLNNLWSASGSGSYQNTPMYVQQLTTVANPWFNVASGREITVLWVYLERVQAWYDQLPPDVQNFLGPFDTMVNNFPHYGTLDTELSPTEINLLANLTAWVIVNAQTTVKLLFQ